MNTIEITVKDETMTGLVNNEFKLKISSPKTTVKELIRSRVYHEVNEYNEKKKEFFQGLVQPVDSDSIEGKVNHYKMRGPTLIDPEKQYYLALSAFQKNGFFMLIDNQQHSDLEEEITIHDNLSISFVRLIALVGG